MGIPSIPCEAQAWKARAMIRVFGDQPVCSGIPLLNLAFLTPLARHIFPESVSDFSASFFSGRKYANGIAM